MAQGKNLQFGTSSADRPDLAQGLAPARRKGAELRASCDQNVCFGTRKHAPRSPGTRAPVTDGGSRSSVFRRQKGKSMVADWSAWSQMGVTPPKLGCIAAKNWMYRSTNAPSKVPRMESMPTDFRNYADVLQHGQGAQTGGPNFAAKTRGVTPMWAPVTRTSRGLRPEDSQQLQHACRNGAGLGRLSAI